MNRSCESLKAHLKLIKAKFEQRFTLALWKVWHTSILKSFRRSREITDVPNLVSAGLSKSTPDALLNSPRRRLWFLMYETMASPFSLATEIDSWLHV